VKIILFFMAPVLLIVTVLGCSKEHSAPTFSKYAVTSKPADVEATYDSETQSVNVSWVMSNTTGVVDYYVSISDSSDIDFGNLILRATNSLERNYSFSVVDYVQPETPTVLYFTVSAVYNIDYNNDGIFNYDDLNYFVGPRADNPDSALVLIE